MVEEPLRFRVPPAQGESDDGIRPAVRPQLTLVGRRGRAMTARDNLACAARRTRRHPRPWQFDYLHLRRLLDDLRPDAGATRRARAASSSTCSAAAARTTTSFAPGVRVVGLDIDDRYGVADIVTTEFLPCADDSYDGVACIEAFHYVADPAHGVRELRRVLKPGGRVVVSVPLVWEYDRHIVEHRYTSGSLRQLFDGWDDVVVVENGGRAVAWTLRDRHAPPRRRGGTRPSPPARARAGRVRAGVRRPQRSWARCSMPIEQRRRHPRHVLAPNILLTARRPADG